MREIKFRAWDNHDKAMCYDINVYSDGSENEYWWAGDWYFESGDKSHFFDNSGKGNVLMQYTGLKDKNGVEIYEGDVIEYSSAFDPKGAFTPNRMKVEWIDIICGFKIVRNGKVIGNIYENPELIE